MKMFKLLMAIILLGGLPASAFAADLTVTYQIKEGKKKGERTVYWSDKFHRTKDSLSKVDSLYDYDAGMMYTIDHREKKIEALNFKDMGGMMGDAQQMMGEMMGRKAPRGDKTIGQSMEESTAKIFGDPGKAVLQKLGTLTVAGRSCDNYKVERKGGKFETSQEVCVDPTLSPPQNPNAEAAQMHQAAEAMSGTLGNLQSPAERELANLKGTPLRRIHNSKTKGMMFGGGNMQMEEEATLVQVGPIDPAVFKLPSGYKQVDQAQMMREQMQDMQKMMDGMGK